MFAQPLNSSFISRVKTEDASVQFVDGTGLHDVKSCYMQSRIYNVTVAISRKRCTIETFTTLYIYNSLSLSLPA